MSLEHTHILKQVIRTITEDVLRADGSVAREVLTEELWIHPNSEEGQSLGGLEGVSEAPLAPVVPLRTWAPQDQSPTWQRDLQAAMERHPAGGRSIVPAPRKPFEGTVEHPDSDWCQPVIPGLEYLDKVDSIDDEGSPT